jgi:hypothetical protein
MKASSAVPALFLVVCVSAVLGEVTVTINSNNPTDVAKYFCSGDEASTATAITADITCPATDTMIANDLEVLGCKLNAGDPISIKMAFTPTSEATTLKQKATTLLGKKPVGMPGLKAVFCDGSRGRCSLAGLRRTHVMEVRIPNVIPLDLIGQAATIAVTDQDNKNVVCFKFPVFIKKGIAKKAKKN